MTNPGFRVKKSFLRPDPEMVKQFAGIPVANIGDNMNRINCMNARIRPMNSTPLLGCAFTVRVRAGDNLLLHKAIDLAQPGDIIVIDAQGESSYSIFGELMVLWLRRRGITGVVVDGCIRDADAIEQIAFPVYARAVSPNGPYKNGPGEIGFPVSFGGQVINPGDILVGDGDGLVAINPDEAPGLLVEVNAVVEKEIKVKADVEAGMFKTDWVDDMLKTKGCKWI